jgi:hypothetical protein
MSKTRILAAAAVLSMIASTQVFAQAAMPAPGTFSQYYPDRDVLNGGAPISAPRTSGTASARLRNHEFHGIVNSANNTRHLAEDAHANTAPGARYIGGPPCHLAPRVGAFATQPWENETPCEPAMGY